MKYAFKQVVALIKSARQSDLHVSFAKSLILTFIYGVTNKWYVVGSCLALTCALHIVKQTARKPAEVKGVAVSNWAFIYKQFQSSRNRVNKENLVKQLSFV